MYISFFLTTYIVQNETTELIYELLSKLLLILHYLKKSKLLALIID